MKAPNYLVITATPYRKDYKSRFLDSYLYSVNKKNVYYFYVTDTSPSKDSFNSAYKLTDKMMFKHFFSKKVNGVVVNNDNFKEMQKSGMKEGRHIPSFIKTIIRSFLWRKRRWYTESLKAWLNDVHPDVILLVWHDNVFLNKIAKELSEVVKAPLLISINDDYLFCKSKSIKLFKYAKELFKKNNVYLFYISDSMKARYDGEFKQNGLVIHPSSELEFEDVQYTTSIKKVCYFGSVSLGRLNSILYFADHLNDRDIVVDVYANSYLSRHDIKQISKHKNVKLKAAVPYEEIKEIIKNYDAILLAEELNNLQNVDKVRYSLTTKIADSLANNKIKLLIGNGQTGLIDFALKNTCGFVITEHDNPSTIINGINAKSICTIQKNIKDIYYKDFYTKVVSERFVNFVEKLLDKKL